MDQNRTFQERTETDQELEHGRGAAVAERAAGHVQDTRVVRATAKEVAGEEGSAAIVGIAEVVEDEGVAVAVGVSTRAGTRTQPLHQQPARRRPHQQRPLPTSRLPTSRLPRSHEQSVALWQESSLLLLLPSTPFIPMPSEALKGSSKARLQRRAYAVELERSSSMLKLCILLFANRASI